MSAVPAVAVFVGFMRRGDCAVQAAPVAAVQPMRRVTVVPDVIVALVVQVIAGAVTFHEQVLALFVWIFVPAFAVVNPLSEKVVADGEAAVDPVPGKVMTIFPPFGTGLATIKEIVCIADMFAIKTSVPPCAAAPAPAVRLTVVSAADWEETVSPVVISANVEVLMIFAESEARYLDPLFIIPI